MSRSHLIFIRDISDVGASRRTACDLAASAGLDATQAGRAGIIATEMANNLVKHSYRGEILVRLLAAAGDQGVEILAIDRGPGMADVVRCLEDGYSTAGSPGTGLGAIVRLSGVFDLYSQVPKGTVMVSQIWSRSAGIPKNAAVLGAVCVPKNEGEPCGDAWSFREHERRQELLVVDGLGHGPLAARAADEAVRVFCETEGHKPLEMIARMNGPLRSTRGASLALAEIALDQATKLLAISVAMIPARPAWVASSPALAAKSHAVLRLAPTSLMSRIKNQVRATHDLLISTGLQSPAFLPLASIEFQTH